MVSPLPSSPLPCCVVAASSPSLVTPLSSSVLELAPVVPVVVVDDVADAVPLARALVAGGLPAIEVTLRTPVALDAIRAIADGVPEAVVGAGTVISPEQVAQSVAAGARFLVSPGWTDVLLDAMKASGVPFLPGVSTTSEVVALLERGVSDMKFFPAQAAGGTAYLKALAGPLPQARFCPTGGIGPGRRTGVPGTAQRPVRGRELDAPADAIAARDWARVETLAREAASLGHTPS
jgi:2-dehydro-3-deoxyphosphogluconate aldolase/(4S)-4-hydroxy-2-oxoglutarate aldolase